MNGVAYTSAADPAEPPAGVYTATGGAARASWIVLPDQSMVGVTSANSKNDREVIDQINTQQADFRPRCVRPGSIGSCNNPLSWHTESGHRSSTAQR